MKKVLLSFVAVFFLTFAASKVSAQEYCFWIVNNRADALNELKVKEKSATSFSQDLLPNTAITQGTPFYVRVTNWSTNIADVQFTDMDGNPLEFILKTTTGGTATFPYIRLDVEALHTLVLNENNTFSVYNDDQLGLGHPCQ